MASSEPLNGARPTAPEDSEGLEDLLLTPSKLRLHSSAFAVYATTWLMHAAFLTLVLLKVRARARSAAGGRALARAAL